MRILIAATLLAGVGLAFAAPANAACTTCSVQTKTASTATPGKFDYTISCTEDSSGDEKITKVTAATDDEAKDMAQKKCG